MPPKWRAQPRPRRRTCRLWRPMMPCTAGSALARCCSAAAGCGRRPSSFHRSPGASSHLGGKPQTKLCRNTQRDQARPRHPLSRRHGRPTCDLPQLAAMASGVALATLGALTARAPLRTTFHAHTHTGDCVGLAWKPHPLHAVGFPSGAPLASLRLWGANALVPGDPCDRAHGASPASAITAARTAQLPDPPGDKRSQTALSVRLAGHPRFALGASTGRL